VAVSVVLGGVISLPLAFARMSKNPVLSWIAYAFVYFFRGTPLLTQLFLVYYGLGSFSAELKAVGLWWFFRDAWNCALLTFTLNTAAYQAEILRGAIESVSRGQHEGAAALGLSRKVAFFKIILPQALIVALRPYGNEIILMIKGSAIVAIVTVLDLMGETRRAFSRTFDYQAYLWAALMYLLMVELLRNVWAWLERRLTRHLKR
jgi:polar amino acid transport system permease protein